MLGTVLPSESVLSQLNRTTGEAVPATGGLASGHELVSVSDISGPLEFRASLMMYCAAIRASLVASRLWCTWVPPRMMPTNAIASAPMMRPWITSATRSSASVKPPSPRVRLRRRAIAACITRCSRC